MAARAEGGDRLVHRRVPIDAVARLHGELHPIKTDVQPALRRRDRDDQLPLVAAVEDVRNRIVNADHREQLTVQADVFADSLSAVEQPLNDFVVDQDDRGAALILAFGEVAPGLDVTAGHVEPVRGQADERDTRELAIRVLDAGRAFDLRAHTLHTRELRDFSALVECERPEPDPRTGFAAAIAGLKLRWPTGYEERRRPRGREAARYAGVDAVNGRRHHGDDENADGNTENGETGPNLVRANGVECDDDTFRELINRVPKAAHHECLLIRCAWRESDRAAMRGSPGMRQR